MGTIIAGFVDLLIYWMLTPYLKKTNEKRRNNTIKSQKGFLIQELNKKYGKTLKENELNDEEKEYLK
jgi:hypothetical protein